MKLSPSFIRFTDKSQTQQITINDAKGVSLTSQSFTLVAITKKGESLTEKECPSDLFINALDINRVDAESYKITIDYSPESFACLKEKSSFLAIKLIIPQGNEINVSTKQQFFIPLFDYTNLGELRNSSDSAVLGTLSNSLQLSPLQCTPSFSFNSNTTVQCATTLTNTAPVPVKANLLLQLTEKIPPYLTLYQDAKKSNLLLLPGESLSVNYQIPETVESSFMTNATLTSTFSLLGDDLSIYSHKRDTSYIVIGWGFAFACIGMVIIISAILSRLRNNKFNSRPHGKHKRQKEAT
ncbi:MAG: hypothetical protein ACOYT9_01740 [Patescibacteria group bacterium]